MNSTRKWHIAALMAALLLCSAAVVSAQSLAEDCVAMYSKFYAHRAASDLPTMKLAVAEGKEYLDKCSSVKEQETQQAYVNKQLPKFAAAIRMTETTQRFNIAGEKNDRDEIVVSGKDLIELGHEASLDIALAIAGLGYDELIATPQISRHREDTIKYAKIALEKLASNRKSDTYGVFKYVYKTKMCPNGAENATGWMNYILGYDLANRDRKAEAVSYFYKATQVGCETKNMGGIYRAISSWYIDKAKAVESQITDKIAAAGGNQTDETRSLDALQDIYLDRALDAMGRAYKALAAAKEPSSDAAFRVLKQIYDSRYNGNMSGFDQFVAKIGEAPLPDPNVEIKAPVVQPKPSPQMN